MFTTQNASLASQAPSWQRCESGQKGQPNRTTTNDYSGGSVLDAAGCGDDLACLRALPFDTVFAAANGTFNPSVIPDGDFVQGPTFKQISQGKVAAVPIIIGANYDESTSGIGAPVGIQNDTQFRSAVAREHSPFASFPA